MLIGSAEHTLGPLHMDETLKEEHLPLRYVGYSTAFRREAGSYGKDTKGILRQHQFDKLEMESFTKPEDGMAEQDFMVAIQEHLMRELKLPHQAVLICTGDMGFPDQRQIDIETWMPGQDTYRETHSADYVGGFQARRLNTKVKRADGSAEPVHMNDATVFAMGRTLIAILENYQQEDGSVAVPEVLRPFMGGKEKIEKVKV
jgi:seryl-tRNA synthetase